MDDYLKGTYLKKLEEEENAMKTFKIAIKKKKDPHGKDSNKSPHLFTQESQITQTVLTGFQVSQLQNKLKKYKSIAEASLNLSSDGKAGNNPLITQVHIDHEDKPSFTNLYTEPIEQITESLVQKGGKDIESEKDA